MTDLEGITHKLLSKGYGEAQIRAILTQEYAIWKELSAEKLEQMAESVIQEVKNATPLPIDTLNPFFPQGPVELVSYLLKIPTAMVTMGLGGVGCRGSGDFLVHSLLAKISQTSIRPMVSPMALDDTGAVIVDPRSYSAEFRKGSGDSDLSNLIILSKMEGMHSRLSDFPFLAGFHVTRAALRDIYVKGGDPISIMVDLHLADDGDIGKLFDFQAGVATVAELARVPITAGSTLRIGGDMVIGDRLTGGIAAIGVMRHNFFRSNVRLGDAILMTEGAGGGTISTTALYSGSYPPILETLNIKFLSACQAILESSAISHSIHCMLDVTNGGLRGDVLELVKDLDLGVEIDVDKVEGLIHPVVRSLLNEQQVDFLGVSLDALLIFCDPAAIPSIRQVLGEHSVKVDEIGHMNKTRDLIFYQKGIKTPLHAYFREAAYTPLKKAVDGVPKDEQAQTLPIRQAFEAAQEKKAFFIRLIEANRRVSQ